MDTFLDISDIFGVPISDIGPHSLSVLPLSSPLPHPPRIEKHRESHASIAAPLPPRHVARRGGHRSKQRRAAGIRGVRSGPLLSPH